MSKALDKIEAFFQSLNKSSVYIGVLGEIHTDKETGKTINMAELAAVHEFGATIEHQGGTRYTKSSAGKAKFQRNSFMGPVHGTTGAHTITIPERSFIRSAIIENKDKYKQQVAALVKQGISDGTPANQIFNMIGAVAAGDAQEKIEGSTLTPLKPETIKRKGSSNPLYDTGQLYQSITWVRRDD